MGLPPDSNTSFEDLSSRASRDRNCRQYFTIARIGQKKTPRFRHSNSGHKQQEAQLAISYSSGMPTLTANTNWTQVVLFSPNNPPVIKRQHIGMNFPIFQGFYYMNQQRQLRAQIEEALANLDVQVAAVSTQVVTNYYSFKAAEAALPSSEAAVEYSQRAYRGFVVQYKTGTASIIGYAYCTDRLSNAGRN